MTSLFIMLGLTIAEQSQPAIRSALEAGYKQSGLEQRLNDATGQLEHKYISPEIKTILSPTIAIGRAIAEQRISITIHF